MVFTLCSGSYYRPLFHSFVSFCCLRYTHYSSLSLQAQFYFELPSTTALSSRVSLILSRYRWRTAWLYEGCFNLQFQLWTPFSHNAQPSLVFSSPCTSTKIQHLIPAPLYNCYIQTVQHVTHLSFPLLCVQFDALCLFFSSLFIVKRTEPSHIFLQCTFSAS